MHARDCVHTTARLETGFFFNLNTSVTTSLNHQNELVEAALFKIHIDYMKNRHRPSFASSSKVSRLGVLATDLTDVMADGMIVGVEVIVAGTETGATDVTGSSTDRSSGATEAIIRYYYHNQ